MPHVVLIGTADTKLDELLYLRSRILDHDPDTEITFIDIGRTSGTHQAVTVSQTDLLKYAATAHGPPLSNGELGDLPRGELLAVMSKLTIAFMQDLLRTSEVHGVIAAGGSGNTSVAAAVMRACPIGLPKLLVSTVASGDVAPIVGETDITLMYSIVDIAGLNRLLRGVLDNAAGAISGMATAYAARKAHPESGLKKALQVGVTMFGVTTPCVDAARKRLEENGAEVYVFHATGTGGKAMERLVREGALDAVLDVTTTEVCDFLVGGNMSAGPERLRAAPERGTPCVVSLGACDMVNFGAKETVPDKFQHRKLLVHNAMVTLMRTSKDECQEVGQWIARRLKESAKDPSIVEMWIPAGGVSMIATPGAPFHDPEADKLLFETIAAELEGSGIRVVRDERPINDEQLAVCMADRLLELVHSKQE
jgi:uncharacterized protein (UPF0261 family)